MPDFDGTIAASGYFDTLMRIRDRVFKEHVADLKALAAWNASGPLRIASAVNQDPEEWARIASGLQNARGSDSRAHTTESLMALMVEEALFFNSRPELLGPLTSGPSTGGQDPYKNVAESERKEWPLSWMRAPLGEFTNLEELQVWASSLDDGATPT